MFSRMSGKSLGDYFWTEHLIKRRAHSKKLLFWKFKSAALKLFQEGINSFYKIARKGDFDIYCLYTPPDITEDLAPATSLRESSARVRWGTSGKSCSGGGRISW